MVKDRRVYPIVAPTTPIPPLLEHDAKTMLPKTSVLLPCKCDHLARRVAGVGLRQSSYNDSKQKHAANQLSRYHFIATYPQKNKCVPSNKTAPSHARSGFIQ